MKTLTDSEVLAYFIDNVVQDKKFIMDKWNSFEIDGHEYAIKIQDRGVQS